jgi:hypothetical protein
MCRTRYSVFGASVEMADKPPEVENIFPSDDSSDYDFFLFTNLENLTSPGRTNIVLTDLPYRRFITQSRWAKFVGWRHKGLVHCETVIYTDAYITPQSKNGLAPFREVAAKINQSEAGLAQDTHDQMNGTPMHTILMMIAAYKKDVAANTNASLKWLQKQPDFAFAMPYYINKWFGKFSSDRSDRSCVATSLCTHLCKSSFCVLCSAAYDPSNLRFQEASSFFWDRYSQELDSWRDQPLWSYALHHFKITPEVLFKKGEELELFIEHRSAMGFGGHRYDHDAAIFRNKQTERN